MVVMDFDSDLADAVLAALDAGLVAFIGDGTDSIHLTKKGLLVAPVLNLLVEEVASALRDQNLLTTGENWPTYALPLAVAQALRDKEK